MDRSAVPVSAAAGEVPAQRWGDEEGPLTENLVSLEVVADSPYLKALQSDVIEVPEGETVEGYVKMLRFYVKLLGTPAEASGVLRAEIIASGPCLSVTLQQQLVANFTQQDVKLALDSICNTPS
ncbi:hypothetical protein Dimus_031213 [Dionaea muscipula]